MSHLELPSSEFDLPPCLKQYKRQRIGKAPVPFFSQSTAGNFYLLAPVGEPTLNLWAHVTTNC